MCQEILRLAGVKDFKVIDNGVYEDADFAFVISETEIPEDTGTKFIKLKLNTFPQIENSIDLVSKIIGTEPLKAQFKYDVDDYIKRKTLNRSIKVKVYSNFLREIAEDMGFSIVNGDNYNFLIYPDYLEDELKEEIEFAGEKAIRLPSHNNSPSNPIKRAEIRYKILEKRANV